MFGSKTSIIFMYPYQGLYKMNKEFLSIKEAAAMIGVSPLTLRNWDNSGKFTASRHPINNYRVYKKAEIEMLIEDLRTKHETIKKPKNQAVKLQIRHIGD